MYKDSENNTKRLCWCYSSYALAKLIVDNVLAGLWRRKNPDSPEFTHYDRSFGKGPGLTGPILIQKLRTKPRLIT